MENLKYQHKTFKLHLMGKGETLKVFEQGNDVTKTALQENYSGVQKQFGLQ